MLSAKGAADKVSVAREVLVRAASHRCAPVTDSPARNAPCARFNRRRPKPIVSKQFSKTGLPSSASRLPNRDEASAQIDAADADEDLELGKTHEREPTPARLVDPVNVAAESRRYSQQERVPPRALFATGSNFGYPSSLALCQDSAVK